MDDLEVYKLHGNIEQRERSETYFKFKNTESAAVLYSTDVAARGLDFPEVIIIDKYKLIFYVKK